MVLRQLRRLLPAVAGMAVVLVPGASWAGQPLSQWRINELAAACVQTRAAMSAPSAIRRPGENPAQFAVRLEGYVRALQTLEADLKPLRAMPTLSDASPANAARWERIVADVNRLPGAETAVQGQIAHKPANAQKLRAALWSSIELTQRILNGLRDARP